MYSITKISYVFSYTKILETMILHYDPDVLQALVVLKFTVKTASGISECRENEDVDCKEGGIRFRPNLKKFVVEYRPPHFKWKMWMGTYASVDEAWRAYDCAMFYAGQDNLGGFYIEDSAALFAEQGPLTRPFSLVSRDVKDKPFNVELKRRAKLVIRKVKDSQTVDKNVESTSSQQLEPLHSYRKESLHSISQISPLEGSTRKQIVAAYQDDESSG